MANSDGASFKQPTPQGELTPEAQAFHDGVEEGLKMGRREGQMAERAEILNFLEKKYMDDNTKRDTPGAQMILKLAREVADHFRNHPIGGDA